MVVHHAGRGRAAGEQAHDIFVRDLGRVLPDLLRLVDGAGGAERVVAAGIVCAGKPKHVRIAHGSAESALPKVVSKQTNNAGSATGVHSRLVTRSAKIVRGGPYPYQGSPMTSWLAGTP